MPGGKNYNAATDYMLPSAVKSKQSKMKVNTAEAFYRIFCVLSKKDRLAVARYILQDEEIRQALDQSEIPNELTLKAFDEDRSHMLKFDSIQDLRDDLLS